MTGGVTIPSGSSLTIEPGVEVRFGPSGSLATYPAAGGSALYANGTAASPILFTSSSATPAPGAYTGLLFHGPANAPRSFLQNATIEYGGASGAAPLRLFTVPVTLANVTVADSGNHGVYIDSASPTLRDFVVDNATGYGIFTPNVNAAPRLEGVTLRNIDQAPLRVRLDTSLAAVTVEGNTREQIEYYGQDIGQNLALALLADAVTGERYDSVFVSGFTVVNQATLTVPPGSRLLSGDGVTLQFGRCCSNPGSRGSLVAEGTGADPITFASSLSNPQNRWGGLYFYGHPVSGISVLRNVTIEDTKNHVWDQRTGLRADTYSSLTLDNVTIQNTGRYGLEFYSSSPTLRNVDVLDAGWEAALFSTSSPTWDGGLLARSARSGIYAAGCGVATLRDLTIENATGYGFYSDQACAGAHLDGVTIVNATSRPWRNRLDVQYTDVTLVNPGVLDVEYWGNDLTSNRTLPILATTGGANLTSTILSGFTVYNQATLTIPAGSHVRFGDGATLQMGRCCSNPGSRGSLRAEGTEAEPILLTSLNANQANGWGGLYFYGYPVSGTSVLRNVTIEKTKNYVWDPRSALRAETYSALTVDNVTVNRPGKYGVELHTSHVALRNVDVHLAGWEAAFFGSSSPVWDGGHLNGSSRSGVYTSGCGAATLRGLLIESPNGYGVFADGACNGAHLENVTFLNPTGRPWRNRLDMRYENLSLPAAGVLDVEYWGNDLTTDRTLPIYTNATGATYGTSILSGFTVYNQATLTIPAGSNLKLGDGATIQMGRCCSNPASRGSLVALGTETEPITFTSLNANQADGWGGLYFYGYPVAGTSVVRNATLSLTKNYVWDPRDAIRTDTYSALTLDNLTIDRPGDTGFEFHSSNPAIKNVRILQSGRQGMAFHSSSPTLRNVTVIQPGWEGAYLGSSTISWQGGLIDRPGRSGLYLSGCGIATLQDLVIERATGYGVFADGTCNGAQLLGVTIIEPTGRPWRNRLDMAYDVTFTDPGILDVEYWGADVTSDRTLPLYTNSTGARLTSTLLSTANVWNGATLTLPPGTVLRSGDGATLQMGRCCSNPGSRGSLRAEGTESDPILLTSLNANQANGWGGLYFYGYPVAGTSVVRNTTVALTKNYVWDPRTGVKADNYASLTLDNVTIDRPGRQGVEVYSSSVTLRNVDVAGAGYESAYIASSAPTWTGGRLNHSQRSGVYLAGCGVATLRGLLIESPNGYGVFADGTCNGAHLDNVQVVSPASRGWRNRIDLRYDGTTLTSPGVASLEYWGAEITSSRALPRLLDDAGTVRESIVLSGFTIRNGATWIVLPGSTVRIADGHEIRAGAFSCCGDTSGRGSLRAEGTDAQPIVFTSSSGTTANGWYGFLFYGYQNAGTSVLRNATVALSRDDGMYADNYASLTVDNVTFSGNVRSGVWLVGNSHVTVKGSEFTGSQYGVAGSDSAPTLRDNGFMGQTVAGYAMTRGHGAVLERNFFNTTNGKGVQLTDSDNGRYQSNEFLGNALGMQLDASSTGNLVANNLFKNTQNVQDAASNTVYSTTPVNGTNVCYGPLLAGNCWSDYGGLDTNADGIGDTQVPYKVGIAGTGDTRPLVVHPSAAFLFDTLNATLGLIQFTDASTSPMWPIVNWTWSFGDGGASHDRNPLHDYDIEGLHEVTLTARDAGGNVGSATRTILLDTLPPSTTGLLEGLAGDAGWWLSQVNVTLTATDAASTVERIFYRVGGTGSFLTYGGPFTLADEGTTLVEYYAVDLGGNAEPTRFLNVSIDETRPITDALLEGTLHGAGWYTTNVTATLLGADTPSGVASTFYRADGGDVTLYAGPVTFTGTGLHTLDPFSKDIAGNLEAVTRREIAIDLTDPVSIATVTAGPEGENGWYVGPVSVAVAATDLGVGVQIVEAALDGGPLAPYASEIPIAGDGVHTVSHRATDLVDHVEATRETVVRIDGTAPAVTLTPSGTQHASGWYVTAPQVTLAATDGTSGVSVTQYEVNGGGFRTYGGPISLTADGVHAVAGRASDLAGNLGLAPSETLRVDLRPPTTLHTITTGTAGMGTWYRSNVSLRLNPTDGTGSGVASTTYQIDGGASLPYAAGSTLSVHGEGVHLLNLTSTDLVGHAEALRTVTLGIDLTTPVSRAVVDGTLNPETGVYHSATTVSFLAEDLLSGIHRVEYWMNGQGPYTNPVTLTQTGTYAFAFRAVDRALNTEALRALNVSLSLDITPPVTSLGLAGTSGAFPWYRSPVTVTLTASDLEAGVGLIEYRTSPTGNWTAYTGAFELAAEGLHRLQYRATDLVGNVEAPKARDIGVDLSAPVTAAAVTGPMGENGWHTGPAQVTLTPTEAVSYVARTDYRLDNGPWRGLSGPITVGTSGVHILEWVTVDAAGNAASGNLTLNVDVDLPVATSLIEGTQGNASWFSSGVVVTLNASDPTSGVLDIQYRLDANASWLPYAGPIAIETEGRHHLEYVARDLSGTPSLVYSHDILVDLTTPLVNVTIHNTQHIEVDGRIYIRGTLCVRVEGLDLLSGLEQHYLRLRGVVERTLYLSLDVTFHCETLEGPNMTIPDGPLYVETGGCDYAGHCAGGGFIAYLDRTAPSVAILRPFPGSVDVGTAAVPLFQAAFENPGVYYDPEAETEVETPNGNETIHPVVALEPDHAGLAATTIAAGPRVPVWIVAHDSGNPMGGVELRLDGVSLGNATEPQNVTYERIVWRETPEGLLVPERENVTVLAYVFELDTLAIPAGAHVVEAIATDLLGNAGRTLRAVITVSPAVGGPLAESLDATLAAAPLPADVVAAARAALDAVQPQLAEADRMALGAAALVDPWPEAPVEPIVIGRIEDPVGTTVLVTPTL